MSLKKIIEVFTQLAEINQQLGEIYKVRAYQNALVSLKRLPSDAKFKSCEELLKKHKVVSGINIKGSLCRRIDEILETGECQELNELLERPDIKVFRDLTSVHDIGVKLAKKLIDKHKIKSIEHLQELVKKKSIVLTRNQTLGLVYYKHLLQRVPYNEITDVVNRIKRALHSYTGLTIIGAGSYRRNLKSKGTSGDIDVLIFYQQGAAHVPTLDNLTDILISKGIILDYFSKGTTKFQGLINNQIVRQIDIRYIPIESYATAMLYFTGSKNFNQMMRQKAIRLGYRLSEYYLTDLHKNKSIPVRTEQDVFKLLKMKYVPPWKRD